jgi:hypothetical protein
MRVRAVASILAAVFPLGAAVLLMGQQGSDKAAMDEKAMMELWRKMSTPAAPHKKLEPLVGSWTARNTLWIDPSKPPAVTDGTRESRWALGGRYVEDRYEGTLMGQPFSGIGYTGYDNYKKAYVGTWMDTGSTAVMSASGSFDSSGKVLTMTARSDDFTTGKVVTIREKVTIVSNDENLFEMWGPGPDGKEYKVMEIRYTRRK